MHQLSLIALYGYKEEKFRNLIIECQRKIADVSGILFYPYDINQIHGTIVGLERADETMSNLNMSRYRNRHEEMDFSGLLGFIRNSGQFPFQIQIGGFQDREYPFSSQGKRPYERSFIMRDNKVVLLGWPVRGLPLMSSNPDAIRLIQKTGVYPNTLDSIRRAIQTFNILHKYHANISDVDNDFYFRIGTLDAKSVATELLDETQSVVRAYLGSITPLIIEITIADIFVVRYEKDELPVNSSNVWSISDPQVTSEFLRTLYA